MVWNQLSEAQQLDIIERYRSGQDIDEIAIDFGIKSSSLSRKIRLLKQNGVIVDIDSTSSKRPVHRLDITTRQRVLIYSDFHAGFSDFLARRAVIAIREIFKPQFVFNLGDILDAYAFSRFSKSPEIMTTLQQERDEWAEFAEELHDNDEDSTGKRYVLRGNHDDRYIQFLYNNPALQGLDEINLEDILCLQELGYHGMYDEVQINPSGPTLYPDAQLYMIHGDMSRRLPGSSVRAESEKMGYASIVMGHVHKSNFSVVPTHRGLSCLHEVGCLQVLQPSYARVTNWNHGVIIGWIGPDAIELQHVIIDRGHFMLSGESYSV